HGGVCSEPQAWHRKGVLLDMFFFSSRRRHTRSKRDWSSDVCSSDLDINSSSKFTGRNLYRIDRDRRISSAYVLYRIYGDAGGGRSEERRVGKEWGVGGGREARGERE